MKPPENMVRIVGRKRYSTKTATLLASDAYWDGRNWERHGRNTYLYKTPKGAYFLVNLTQWQGERDTITPVSLEEALELFEGSLSSHEEKYAEAFPTVEVEEA